MLMDWNYGAPTLAEQVRHSTSTGGRYVPVDSIPGRKRVSRSRSGQIPHNRIDVQLGKTTLDWKQRQLRVQHLVLAIEYSPVFALCNVRAWEVEIAEH